MAKGIKTGGRKPGVKNKRTLARECAQAETAAKIEAALGDEAFQGDAHAFLVAVYKDLTQRIEIRIDAAKAAIGYEKPKLAALDAKVESNVSLAELVNLSCEISK